MGLILDPHESWYRETCGSHLAHNPIPSPPCCLGTMFLLSEDSQAQLSTHRKSLKAAAIPSDCPVKLPGTQGSTSWGGLAVVHSLPPRIIPLPRKGMCGAILE